MNVFTKLFKNNECFNSCLLCYLCTSYYKPYSRYCQLIIVSLIGSLWKLFNVWAINWRKIVKKVKKQLFLKTFLFFLGFEVVFICKNKIKKVGGLKLIIYLALPTTREVGAH